MRTIVYDAPDVQKHYKPMARQEGGKTRGGRSRRVRKQAEDKAKRAEAVPDEEATRTDGYLSKIAKYVPAETITIISLMFAAFTPTGRAVWWWVAAGAVVNVIYLFSVALGEQGDGPRPRVYFYILSAGAFVLWSMATLNAVQTAAGLTGENAATKQTALLALAAFLVPALDTIFTRIDVSLKS